MRVARLTVAAAALGLLAWLLVGRGLPNYDTLHELVWGRQLAHGTLPDLDAPLAPTPHPLAILLALVGAPLSSATSGGLHGIAGTDAVTLLAFAALGALGVVTYLLGARWFHPAVGVLAAAIVLTRRPILDFGARGYVDVPYLVLVLSAALVESRRPRAGVPVLVLLGIAGLIRPEAWLFAIAYALWLRDVRLLALAFAAPVLWCLADLALTGDPLHSLTGTRGNAEVLQRTTGLGAVPGTVPRRIGEVVREPVLLGALGGGVMSLLWLRDRRGIRVGTALGVVSLVAFCVLAAAGLPILGRYLLLPSVVLVVFGAAGALGWLALPRDDPRRRPWQAWAALTVLALVVFAPGQADRIRGERRALARQAQIQADLGDLVRAGTLARTAPCRPLAVPNRRPVPLLALWLDVPPASIGAAQDATPVTGTYFVPADRGVARDYVLDPRDLDQAVPPAPAGFRPTTRSASWRAYARCPG